MNFNNTYFKQFSEQLFSIPSPSGFCHDVMNFIKDETSKLGYDFTTTPKGNGIISIPDENKNYTIGLAAHVDTLGAMIRSISSNGHIKFTPVGGPQWPTLDGEYCKIHTRDGKIYTGTFLSNSYSSHAFKDASSLDRKPENMYVRIDEKVKSKDDVLKLGIANGDYISIEPKTTFTENGFIKSRFLDDKISVSTIFTLLKYFKDNNITPKNNLKIIVSTYEEVGHGSASIPEDINELIAVDMGTIGSDLECTEYDVSICAKDSSGPYDYDITSKFISIAKEEKLNYAVDIYPFYGSDVSAALRAGNNIKGALIGPGVHASHGMERTHMDAINNTLKLMFKYLTT